MSESNHRHLLFIGPALLIFSSVVIWLITSGSEKTWGYFSNFNDQLINISIGLWATPPVQGGTSLEAEKSASGFWERRDDEDHIGVRGEVCVTNDGDLPSENLAILDTVQIKVGPGSFVDYISAPVDLSSFPVLMPGETRCYSYEIEFSPVDRAKYRNLARVTITNHSGWLPGGPHCPGEDPCPFGPEPKASFRLPDAPDEWSDNMPILPDSNMPTPSTIVPTQSDDNGTRQRPTASEATATPQATPPITPSPELSPTPLPTPTPAPTQNPLTGCTHSVDYWRGHPRRWPLHEVSLGGEIYSREEALALLAELPGKDASLELGQQLIAARLNIASGADFTVIVQTLIDADAWLTAHPPGSSPGGSENDRGREIARVLESYNLGAIGPGACKEVPLPTLAPTQPPPATSTWTPTLSPTETLTPEATPSPSPTEVPTAAPTEETDEPTPTLPLPTPTLAPPQP